MNHTSKVETVIKAIRTERSRRRTSALPPLFDWRYTFDDLSSGPYACHDRSSNTTAVDVIGLMYDLRYQAAKPGGEAVVLDEAERELKGMVSSSAMLADVPHLRMLVSLVHRIINVMAANGDLRRVDTNEWQPRRG